MVNALSIPKAGQRDKIEGLIPRMMTLREAAKETGLTYSCLRRWILSGEFVYYVKSGSKYLVNMERLAEFLNQPASVKG